MSIGMSAVYRQRIEKEERRIGEPLELLHEMLSASPGLLTRFLAAAPLLSYGRAAPPDALNAARLAAIRAEDCGPCVKIQAGHARLAGMDKTWIRAAATGRFDDLPDDLALATRLGDAIARNLPEAATLGDEAERRWGRAARVELSLAAAVSRIYPAMKRGLGLAQSCAILDFDD
ncbi:MAG: hypothetical protein ACMVY4_20555 [Minwuia sp.]|uniref:hypothetical protein n=1 Tax=Minwuia sp. TaxID=2493630 RepID=UPI003A868DA8